MAVPSRCAKVQASQGGPPLCTESGLLDPVDQMDERRAHLVAAAEAVRSWVHVQRATWAASPTAHFTAVRPPALAPSGPDVEALALSLAAAHATAASVDATFDRDDSAPTPTPIDFRAHADRLLRPLRALPSFGVFVLQRFWRVGLAAAVVLACTGTARVYWPTWSRVLKAQLAAAGAHAAVFNRLKTAAAASPTALDARPSSGQIAAPPRRTGRLEVESFPLGAQVIVDGRDRGVTPVTVTNLAVGGHGVVFRGEAGEVRRKFSIAADKATKLSEAIYSGWLHLSSPIELQVSEAGSGIQLDDSNHVLLRPGPHEVRFESRTFGFVEVKKLDVRPGETTSVSVVPPPSRLTVVASTPAEVLLDGALIGGTPLTNYALAVGTRELTVRNAAGVERRTMLTVTVEPVRIAIDFSKP